MKTKHNKKRNTAFIYEALVREMAKSIVEKDKQKKNRLTQLFQEFFGSRTLLQAELQCYRALCEASNLAKYDAEKMVFRAKHEHSKINQRKLFEEKSRIINHINKQIGPHVFTNFVPNYKTFATVAQIFSEKTPLKKKVLMESQIVELLSTPPEVSRSMKPVDSLVVQSFSTRFNEKYGGLLAEQKQLLGKYIVSFGSNDADFRVHLVSELKRIHKEVRDSLVLTEVLEDTEMVENTKKVLEQVEEINVSMVDAHQLKKILKLQQLVSEYQNDAS